MRREFIKLMDPKIERSEIVLKHVDEPLLLMTLIEDPS